MKKLTWWFRIVGGFYALLALMNMYFVLFNPAGAMVGEFPFAVTADSTMAFIDGWSAFAFATLGISTFLLWASRNPLKYLGAVWLVVWLEIWYGIADDVYLIARGYDAVGYIVFIVIHLAIIVTGVMFARQAQAE